MTRPRIDFEWKITIGNLLTAAAFVISLTLAWGEIRSDLMLKRERIGRLEMEQEKMRARDEFLGRQLSDLQRDTVASLARLEAQMGLMLRNAHPR